MGRPDPTAVRPSDGLAHAIALGKILAALLLFTISPLALLEFGWQYGDTGGSPLEKFHPSTLLAVLLIGLAAMTIAPNPLAGLLRLFEPYPALLAYFATNVVMIFYAGLVLKLPVTMFVETFIGAGLIFVLFQTGDETTKGRIALLIHVALLANALLAFYEAATQTKLTPLVVNGEVLADEPRSNALLGHPLANAMLMACYVVILAIGGGRDLARLARPVFFLVALASLIPFGGRAGTAACLGALLFILVGKLWLVVRGGRVDTRTIIAGFIVWPVAGLGLLAAFEMGAFDTLTNRLFDDDGSAGTRIEMFQLFRYLTVNDLLFGPDPDLLSTWVRIHGLEYGIESFIIAFVLNYGLLAAVMFFPAFALFLRELIAVTRPGSWLVIVVFLLIALTSISLSAKSPTLSVFVLMLTILLRPTHETAASGGSG